MFIGLVRAYISKQMALFGDINNMFGYSLIRTKKLDAIFDKIAIFALDKIRYQNQLFMDIKGKVIQVLPMEGGTSKSGNQWSKASLIVETTENPKYPKKVKISNMKNADTFSKIAVGSEVTFKVEIESREYNGRWYTEVNCWGWDTPQVQQTPAQPAPQAQNAPAQEENDQLPF